MFDVGVSWCIVAVEIRYRGVVLIAHHDTSGTENYFMQLMTGQGSDKMLCT